MTNKLNSAQIRGFFEGDGGIQIRVDKTKNGFSFRSQAKFGQTTINSQILEWIQHSIDPNVRITNFSGTSSSSYVLPFDSPAGQKFIQMYLQNKPVNPGTLKDFLIALLIHEYQTNNIFPISESDVMTLLMKDVKLDNKRIEILTLLWLRYQRPALRQTERSNPITEYQSHIQATPSEIEMASWLGEQFLRPIDREVSELVSKLDGDKINIPEDFVAYYHTADGSLSFDFETRALANNKRKIKIEPRWTITDDMLAKPLLLRIVRQYNMSSYQQATANSGYARARGWEKTLNVTVPFFRNKKLPDVIANKVENFLEVCELYQNKDTFEKADLYRSFVRKAYFCNPSSGRRTEETFNRDFKDLMEATISEKKMKNSST